MTAAVQELRTIADANPVADRRDAPPTSGAVAFRSDAALATEAAAGSHEAFDALIERYADRVYGLLRHRCPTPQDAEDVAQETFLGAWRSISRYDPCRPFASWLFAIAVRRAASAERTRRRRIARASGADHPERTSAARPPTPRDRTIWDAAARHLPPRTVTLLWLVYAEGLTPTAAAEVVGSTAVLVRVTLHRARKKLAQILDDPAGDTP
jgi:RNA polymerase sigma factor (sigma-70 family)